MANVSLRSPLFAALLALAGCGPHSGEPSSDAASGPEEDDGADDACAEGSCPDSLFCGPQREFCRGGLRLAECIDGRCSPAPRACAGPEADLGTCSEICNDSELVCAENACGGFTIFVHPGPDWVAGYECGSNTQVAVDEYSPLEGGCDAPLRFDGYAYAQCCCDEAGQ